MQVSEDMLISAGKAVILGGPEATLRWRADVIVFSTSLQSVFPS